VSYAHRDIKPGNVLLFDGTPVLADFGSASPADISTQTRKEALALQEEAAEFSTMPFRAPELFEVQAGWGEVGNTLCATDVWALGITLYAMLYGVTPFERAAGPQGSLTLAIAQGKYDTPEPPAPARPADLLALVRDTLVLDPRGRPSATEVNSLSGVPSVYSLAPACYQRPPVAGCSHGSAGRVPVSRGPSAAQLP